MSRAEWVPRSIRVRSSSPGVKFGGRPSETASASRAGRSSGVVRLPDELAGALAAAPEGLRAAASGKRVRSGVNRRRVLAELCVSLHEAQLRRAIAALFLLTVCRPVRGTHRESRWEAVICAQARQYLDQVLPIAADAEASCTWQIYRKAKRMMMRKR
jgi:hypothetical protein